MNKKLAVIAALAFAAPCSAQVVSGVAAAGGRAVPGLPPALPATVILGSTAGDPFTAVASLEGSVHRPGGVPVLTSDKSDIRPNQIYFLPDERSRDEGTVRRLESLGVKWVDGVHLNDGSYRYSIEAKDDLQAAAVSQALSHHYRRGVVLIHPSVFRRLQTEGKLMDQAKLLVWRLEGKPRGALDEFFDMR